MKFKFRTLSTNLPKLIKSTSVDFQLGVTEACLMTDSNIWRRFLKFFFKKGPSSKTNLNTCYLKLQNWLLWFKEEGVSIKMLQIFELKTLNVAIKLHDCLPKKSIKKHIYSQGTNSKFP